MRLLIVTQTIDIDDPVLGFFCRWAEEFAKHTERIEVICLREGKHALPASVGVHSLGKIVSSKQKAVGSRIRYAFRFLSLVWRLRRDYDVVFVHMNQEYILLAGWLWKLLGKRIYLWRNHYAGSWLTDAAAALCTKVFCTSKHSYTAKYEKTVLMPVGVDTERFFPDTRVERKPHSILFLARMAPSKRPEMLIDALLELAKEKIDFTATFVGSPLPEDEAYYRGLKERARTLGDRVAFLPGVPQSQTPDLYRAHEIFVNASPSGMLDKTIFEATASGCTVLAASKDWRDLTGEDYFSPNAESLVRHLKTLLKTPDTSGRAQQETVVASQSLSILASRLKKEV